MVCVWFIYFKISLLKLKISEGARTQIMTRGPFWLSTALNISKNNKHCYIMGDYNIDMFRLNEHSPTQEFVESLFSHMFVPLINRPTRITAHSGTLIDNIFTNHLTPNLFSGILINDLSDHLPIFVYTFKESLPLSKRDNKAVTRDFSENNTNKCRTYLTNINWPNLL